MKIAIIGGGAIGLLFAHYLSREHDVTIYVHKQEQADLLSAKGLVTEREGHSIQTMQKSFLFKDWHGVEDMTIVAVKQYHLPELLPLLKNGQTSKTSILFLQNGMGHLKWLGQIDKANVYVGTVEHGSLKISGNHIVHTGTGTTKIAGFSENAAVGLNKTQLTGNSDFPFEWKSDYQQMLSEKLLVNAVINPLTAILQIKNGDLIDNPDYFQVLTRLYDEVSDILRVEDKEKGLHHVHRVCVNTAANFSSMYKDIENGRKTEVDAILGYLLEEAEEIQYDAPLTALFYSMIKGKEISAEK